ncbi:hypothetical protein Tco_1308285 [Tanacetum coccineum]
MKAPLLQRLSAQGAKIMKWNQGENLKCPFCKDCEDSHNHLFFQCPEVAKVWNKLKAKGKLQSAPDTLDRVVDLIAARPFNKNIWRILQRLIISSMAKLNTLIVKKTCAVLTVAKEWGFSWDNKRLIKIFGMGVWVMDVCTFWLMASCVSSQDFADHNTGGQSSFVGLILRSDDSEKDIVPFPLNDSVEGTYGSLKEGTDTKIKFSGGLLTSIVAKIDVIGIVAKKSKLKRFCCCGVRVPVLWLSNAVEVVALYNKMP